MIKIKKRIHVNLMCGDGGVDGGVVVTHCRRMLKISIFGSNATGNQNGVSICIIVEEICGFLK